MSWTNTAQAMSAAAVNALSKYTQKCSDCGSSDFVEDFSAGDLVCQVGVMPRMKQSCLKVPRLSSLLPPNLQRCGVVAESHTIDERSEWRTFGDSVRPDSASLLTSFSTCPCASMRGHACLS